MLSMLHIDDPRWTTMNGGYRTPYDPRPGLQVLRGGGDQTPVWAEFWNELHHQGDIGEASYAAVPYLVEMQKTQGTLDWNFYALVSTIEIERHRKSNPAIPEAIPDWLMDGYQGAWSELAEFAWRDFSNASDALTQRAILGAVALSKGLLKCGALLSTFDESEMQEILETYMA
jgi:hypothetical protein